MQNQKRMPVLSPRLRAIADWVRPDAVLADIGTDHALLPVLLRLSGKVRQALASDIGAGPLGRAAETVAQYGAEGITLIRCDGLQHPAFAAATDLVIAGMGGELIAAILAAAPALHTPERRWLLQPMSRDPQLRAYLCRAGFVLDRERVIQEGRHLYPLLAAYWDGRPRRCEAVFGEIGLLRSRQGAAEAAWIAARLRALEEKRRGLERASNPVENPGAVQRLIEAIREADV